METRIRSLRPERRVLDRGTDHWRGGYITSPTAGGGLTAITMLAEAHMTRTKTCATALIPAGALSLNCPVACRVTGNDADSYVIAEVRGSFTPDLSPFGVVPRSITGEPETWWEE